MKKKTFVSHYAMFGSLMLALVMSCAQSKTGTQSLKKGNGTINGGNGNLDEDDDPPPAVAKFVARGDAVTNPSEQPDSSARPFGLLATKKIKCEYGGAAIDSFRWNELSVFHLSPSVVDTGANGLASAPQTLVHLGASNGNLLAVNYIPVRAANQAQEFSLRVMSSFYGRFKESGTSNQLKEYKFFSTQVGYPAPVQKADNYYFTPKLKYAASDDPSNAEAAVAFYWHISFDSSKTLANQAASSLLIVTDASGSKTYKAKCAYLP